MFGKNKRCKPCESTQVPDAQFFPTVPTCPGQVPFNTAGCISNKGKFYDRITKDFLLPIVGQTSKAYICEPELWSACQWVAFCYQNNSIAILKVAGSDQDSLILVNACSDGSEIGDNPPPGTKFPSGTVIYPVPPPWCGADFCEKLVGAIENSDCACQGVLACLAKSEEVCLSSVPEIQEGEELHLFGGTMGEGSDPSLWESCIKKLKKIFTGYTGKSLCFSDLPETTDSPDIIDGNPVSKHLVYLDGFSCLRKGAAVTGGTCNDDLKIVKDDDDHNPLTADKEIVFESIHVCDGDDNKRIVKPSDECTTIKSFKDTSNNRYWQETPIGGRFFWLDTNMVLALGDNINLTDYAKYKKMAGGCKLYAIVSLLSVVNYASSAVNTQVTFTINGVAVAIHDILAGVIRTQCEPNAFVPLTENKISITHNGGGGATVSITARLRGYIVG